MFSRLCLAHSLSSVCLNGRGNGSVAEHLLCIQKASVPGRCWDGPCALEPGEQLPDVTELEGQLSNLQMSQTVDLSNIRRLYPDWWQLSEVSGRSLSNCLLPDLPNQELEKD